MFSPSALKKSPEKFKEGETASLWSETCGRPGLVTAGDGEATGGLTGAVEWWSLTGSVGRRERPPGPAEAFRHREKTLPGRLPEDALGADSWEAVAPSPHAHT